MLQFINLGKKRESKDSGRELVTVQTTPGYLRLTPAIQAKLGVEAQDGLVLVVSPADNKTVYIAKGVKGEFILDEHGNPTKDSRGRTNYVEGTGFGSILRPASEGSRFLGASSTTAWYALGGNSEMVRTFTIGEGVEGTVPTERTLPNGEAEMHVATFYPLVFESEAPKLVRKAKGEGDNAAGDGQVDLEDSINEVENEFDTTEDSFENEEEEAYDEEFLEE